MTVDENRLVTAARAAAQKNDWSTVYRCAHDLVKRNPKNPEGFFFLGMAERAARQFTKSIDSFEKCLALDERRFDAGIELAGLYAIAVRNNEAIGLLQKYAGELGHSPWYLDRAAATYIELGKPKLAIPLIEAAVKLQPEMPFFQTNLAAAYVFIGEIEKAKEIYQRLLLNNPNNQRNHFFLSRLGTATDSHHVDQMKAVLQQQDMPNSKNVFINYALGKELEDLENWDEAFGFYKKGANGVKELLNYKIEQDEDLIEEIIRSCDGEWYQSKIDSTNVQPKEKRPIFMVGLPRTGTTLAERILSGHSKIETIGETQFFELVLKMTSGVKSDVRITPEVISSSINTDPNELASRYLDKVSYLWGDKEYFIDKLPQNYLYLGFFAAAFPDSPIIWIRRNPMDSCVAMFKQLFTRVYEFSYSFDDLARYYVIYEKLFQHWKAVLGDRIIEIEYENLVTDISGETAAALKKMGLEFEQGCIDFDKNPSASTTASSVQIREKIHSRSVLKWKHYEKHLEPLKLKLEAAGIKV